MNPFLIKLMLVLGWSPYKMYEVIEPKDNIEVVALIRLDSGYDDLRTDSVESFTMYMRIDSVVYRDDEIVKIKKLKRRER